jgi:1-aminocyclopropane-1-carboxylate deaminase/D-cysteine desulfhydrase-like pyridoxal-dependent ACC family enzyme
MATTSPSTSLTKVPIPAAELRERINGVPRVKLAKLPTPLDDAQRLSAALGGPRILIKRDDLTGLALGGNKTRMLDFRMANALKQGADCIINGAATQSNDCRQTAAAGAKLGLQVYLVLRERRKRVEACPQGNLLLDHLFGATVITIDRDAEDDQRQMMLDLAEKLRREGRRPYLALDDFYLWAIGYADCLLEIYEQLDERGIQAHHIYLTANLMSHAGMLLGSTCLGVPFSVVGVNPSHHQPETKMRIADLTTEAGHFLGLDVDLSADQVNNIDDYVGEGYGVATKRGIEAIKLLARTEGILLDPVYSGKGMSALIDHIQTGKISRDETVVFVHTGGVPSLFAYNEELMD